MAEQWCSSQEAADLLGITPRTLYKLIDEGQLRGFKIGRKIQVKRADLEAFLDANVIKPGELSHLYPAGATDE